MKSLETIEEFREAVTNRALVLVRDGKYGDRVHRLPCTFATAHTFKMKVLVNGGGTGAFFEVLEAETAGIRRCSKCS